MPARVLKAKILPVFLPRFSRLVCLLFSRILQNNLLELHLVEIRRNKLSFCAKATTTTSHVGPPFFSVFERSLREAQNSPWARTTHIIGLPVGQIWRQSEVKQFLASFFISRRRPVLVQIERVRRQ